MDSSGDGEGNEVARAGRWRIISETALESSTAATSCASVLPSASTRFINEHDCSAAQTSSKDSNFPNTQDRATSGKSTSCAVSSVSSTAGAVILSGRLLKPTQTYNKYEVKASAARNGLSANAFMLVRRPVVSLWRGLNDGSKKTFAKRRHSSFHSFTDVR